MSGSQKNDKDDLGKAYFGINDGVFGILAGCSVIGRYLWNVQMRFLRSIGVMPFFVSHWWLFLVLGFVLLAIVMPLGVVFVGTAFAASQMAPKSQDDFIVPLRQGDMDSGKLRTLAHNQADKLREYGEKMGVFKDTTLGWVIRVHGPLLDLPKDIDLPLIMYLTEASAEACKCIGIHEDLHESMHVTLLQKLGLSVDFASGAVTAVITNPFKDNGPTAGELAYDAWDRGGAEEAVSHIEKAFSDWSRIKDLSGELNGMGH